AHARRGHARGPPAGTRGGAGRLADGGWAGLSPARRRGALRAGAIARARAPRGGLAFVSLRGPIPSAMSASSFEADLRAEREAAGVSIEQIQHETRIPADVIQRFEAGKLMNDPAFNEVYLKAFLRAYAGAIGL